jgi:hypothetical protein
MQQPPSSTSQLPQQPQYEITDADRARQKKIAQAWKAYEGDLEKPLRQMPDQPDDNVMSNRCVQIVNAGVDFLFGQELEISAEEGAPQEAQELLDTTWGRKEARIPLLQKLAMNGALAGQSFLRIVPEPDNTYRLVIVDPCTVFIKTAPQDCETVLLYCIEYSTNEKVNGKSVEVFYREEIQRIDPDNDGDDGNPFADTDATWQIQHWSRQGAQGAWTPAGEPIAWNYPFPPLFTCQNLPKPNDSWGYPDITPDIIGLNNSLNLLQSNINRIEKIYGGPILYATGMGDGEIDIKPGKIIKLPLPDSKIVAVSIAADVANALNFANNVRSDMDEQSAVPGVATGRIADIPRGTISGIALNLLFMPLLKKTGKKQCLYGEMIINVSKALFVLNGLSGDIDVTLSWVSPLPDDNLADVQSAIAKKELGASSTTLLRELGYDPEEEAELKKKEDAQKLINFSQGVGLPPAMPGVPPLPGQPPVVLQPQQEGGV